MSCMLHTYATLKSYWGQEYKLIIMHNHVHISKHVVPWSTLVALVFGKSSTPRTMENLRTHSVTLNWSDSDSSIDSMPSSSPENSDNEGDWPERTGFHVRRYGNQWDLRIAHSDIHCSRTDLEIHVHTCSEKFSRGL